VEKRRLIVYGIVLIAIISVGTLLFHSPGQATSRNQGDAILIIRLYGTIQETGGGSLALESSITPHYVENQLKQAARDPSVRGVVLRISSPGGSVAASQEIYRMVADFEKPIVISMGDVAASGGYYIAVGADAIVANPGTTTGSIGVITTALNLDELYDKLGIRMEIIKSGRHKDMFQRALTEEERQLLQDFSDEAYEQFITAIAEGRQLDAEYVRQLATGEVFIGSQALELNLVDRLGGIDEAVALAGELAGVSNPVAKEVAQPSFWQQIFGLAAAQSVELLRDRTLPVPSEFWAAFEGLPIVRY